MSLGLEVIVVGAGGHAKVVISSLRAVGWGIRAVYDDDHAKWTHTILGVPITGPVDRLSERDRFPAIIAIGDLAYRQRVAVQYDRDWITVIHPGAYVDASATIGPGTVVFAGAVIQPDVTVGAHAIINTAASVDHDCVLGDFVSICPGAHLAATVQVDRGAFVGTGATVIPHILIGEHAVIGAGATVIRNVPPHATAVGCPAQVIKLKQ